jgi:hypothetical protein
MLLCCAHGWCGVGDICSLQKKALAQSAGMPASAAHMRSLTCTAAAAAAEFELLVVEPVPVLAAGHCGRRQKEAIACSQLGTYPWIGMRVRRDRSVLLTGPQLLHCIAHSRCT